MPIQENALNSALAEALSEHDLHATPEQTRAKTGAQHYDLQIRRPHGDRYFTAHQCKIGQNTTQQKAAVKDAQCWLTQSDCWNALALCYPWWCACWVTRNNYDARCVVVRAKWQVSSLG